MKGVIDGSIGDLSCCWFLFVVGFSIAQLNVTEGATRLPKLAVHHRIFLGFFYSISLTPLEV